MWGMARRELAAALKLGKYGDLLQGVQGALPGGVGPLLRGVELECEVYALSLAVPGVIPLADLRKVGICILLLNALAVKRRGAQAKVGFQIPAAGSELDCIGVCAKGRLVRGLLLSFCVLLPEIANDGGDACSHQQRQE
jgi:hypothetical protein